MRKVTRYVGDDGKDYSTATECEMQDNLFAARELLLDLVGKGFFADCSVSDIVDAMLDEEDSISKLITATGCLKKARELRKRWNELQALADDE